MIEEPFTFTASYPIVSIMRCDSDSLTTSAQPSSRIHKTKLFVITQIETLVYVMHVLQEGCRTKQSSLTPTTVASAVPKNAVITIAVPVN